MTNPASGRERPTGGRRTALIVTAVLGFCLALAPFAMNMFERAPKGATMLSDFKPFMTSERLDGFQTDMKQVDSAVREVDHKALPRLGQKGSAKGLHSYQAFARKWPQIDATMTDLLDKVQGNLGNYQDMAALPSFRLFPYLFAVPGAIILIVSLLALAGRFSVTAGRFVFAVLGLGLIAVPIASQMFSRAPHGAKMMATFKDIETDSNLARIQGYFSTMAVGQGAIRNQIVPALAQSGLSKRDLATDYPSTTALDANWVHILNDMTPMIAAMSDSVSRYDAIRSLPPFTLFPWFFVGPGVILLAAAIGARRPTGPRPTAPIAVAELVAP